MKDCGRKDRCLLGVLLVCLCLTGCGRHKQYEESVELVTVGQDAAEAEGGASPLEDDSGAEQSADPGQDASDAEQDPAVQVFVHVCGAVHVPGVYELTEGARVYEAIGAAGGVTEEAAAEYINQARPVEDGERIFVPTAEEAEQGIGLSPEASADSSGGKININTAGKDELMTLTGIGESKASSIISYRESHGRFRSIEDLMQIEGIKEGVFNKIKDDITV